MELTELLLKYDQISDGARILTSQADWDALKGTLLGKGNIINITVKNIDTVNGIAVNSDDLPIGSYVSFGVITPGGSLNPNDLKLTWPNGSANVSLIIDRVANLRYVRIPVREK
jgi:hypothetical protein